MWLSLGAGLLAGCAHRSQSQSGQTAPACYTVATSGTAQAAAGATPAAAATPAAIPAPQVQSQVLQPGQTLDPLALQWPRFFNSGTYEFAIYQPQISQWPSNQIRSRFAAAVRPAGTTNETYGVIFFSARTEIDKVNRLVTLEAFQVAKVDFPTQSSMQKQYGAMI